MERPIYMPCKPYYEIICNWYGYTVYGVREKLVYNLQVIPMRLFISLHRFKYFANRAGRKWLEQNGISQIEGNTK